MATTVTAYTKFYIGTQKAASVAADYASDSYAEVAEITNLGEFGDDFTEIKVETIGEARVRKLKGTADAGDVELECLYLASDPGQTAMRAAANTHSTVDYNFKVVLNDAPVAGTPSIFYFSGKVMSARTKLGGPNDPVKIMLKTSINTQIIGVVAATA